MGVLRNQISISTANYITEELVIISKKALKLRRPFCVVSNDTTLVNNH